MPWSVRAIPVPDGDQPEELWVDDRGRLVREPVGGAEPLPGGYVAYGLVDAHAHPAAVHTDAGPVARDPEATLELLSQWGASGVGLVRDTGSPGGSVLGLVLSPGMPRLQAAGRFLAPPGRYFPGLLPEAAPADQLTSLALGELARGSRWVKIIADFPPLADGQPAGLPEPTYPAEAVAAMIDAVHKAGGRVAAHATTDLAADLVRAGVDSIEHGTALDEQTVRLMASTGAAWTPTLSAVLAGVGRPGTEEFYATLTDQLRSLLPLARQLGVPVLAGTDAVGTIAGEIALLAEYGLAPADALRAATTTGYGFLHEPGGQSGEPATLVTYDSDPREDLAVLAAPRAVIIGGVRVR